MSYLSHAQAKSSAQAPSSLAKVGWLLCAALVLTSASAAPADSKTNSATFTNPIAPHGADPWVIQRDGAYYYCQSRRDAIWVARSEDLVGIGKAIPARVWSPPRRTAYSRELWAPELHYLQGKWFIYFAADDGDNFNHRMYVLEGRSQNPQEPFEFRGQLRLSPDRWAIDGTVLQRNDRLYFIWSGWEGSSNVAQNLYLAPMKDPLTISGDRVCISRPEHAWEKNGEPWVNEGPEALWHNGRLFIIYSASGSWGDDYCLGQLSFTGDDPLKADAWTKKGAPVFARTATVFGPGHCSFTHSPDGKEDWIVYHAAKYAGGGWHRDVRIQRFDWNGDGSPHFGAPLTPGEPIARPGSPTLPGNILR
jgi:GH43 family beta-xylosidase